jgi:hypothetical protein
MTRVVAAALVLSVLTFPLGVYPAAPVTWLVSVALLAAGAGVALLSVPLVTAGGILVLIAHAVALLVARPAIDPVAATLLGVTLTLLLLLVHFAGRAEGALLGPGVLLTQARDWLITAVVGALAAVALTALATELANAFQRATLPVIVAAAALGAALTVAGVVKLYDPRR